MGNLLNVEAVERKIYREKFTISLDGVSWNQISTGKYYKSFNIANYISGFSSSTYTTLSANINDFDNLKGDDYIDIYLGDGTVGLMSNRNTHTSGASITVLLIYILNV